MFGYCTALGPLGWLLMVLLWTGVLATAVWGISRLFPSPQDHGADHVPHGEPFDATQDVAGRGATASGSITNTHEKEKV